MCGAEGSRVCHSARVHTSGEWDHGSGPRDRNAWFANVTMKIELNQHEASHPYGGYPGSYKRKNHELSIHFLLERGSHRALGWTWTKGEATRITLTPYGIRRRVENAPTKVPEQRGPDT